ncbi:hypothetical protein CR513_04220, partial [Mucuna pruriens]
MSYTKLLPHLLQHALVTTVSLKPVQSPYPKNYDPRAKCEYHRGALGHTTEKCWGIKHKVQDLIDAGLLVLLKEQSKNTEDETNLTATLDTQLLAP